MLRPFDSLKQTAVPCSLGLSRSVTVPNSLAGPALVFAGVVPASAPALAQDIGAPPPSVCVARPGNTAGSPDYVIMLRSGDQAAMAALGYVLQSCAADPDAPASYRERICHLANDAPEAVQSQFRQEHDVMPRTLCDMANFVAGQVS